MIKATWLVFLDKKARRELLSEPARLEFLHEAPTEWPAWNMDWNDRQKSPIGYMNENPSIRIAEDGNVRVSLESPVRDKTLK